MARGHGGVRQTIDKVDGRGKIIFTNDEYVFINKYMIDKNDFNFSNVVPDNAINNDTYEI